MAEEDKKVTEVATATAVTPTVSPDDEKLGAKCCKLQLLLAKLQNQLPNGLDSCISSFIACNKL